MDLSKYFRQGMIIYGYNNGFLGDDFGEKVCMHVSDTYVVFLTIDGSHKGEAETINASAFQGYTDEGMKAMIEEWRREDE